MNILTNKVVLLTGGSGSFGEAFVMEALKHEPQAIRIYCRGEPRLMEMRRRFGDRDNLRYVVGDIRDRERLDAMMTGVDIVVHAAALKHVVLGERNPQEFIKTNIMGSLNVLEVAVKHKVKLVLGISSDKAVEPISTYGMSKAIMERLFCDANRFSAPITRVSCIRSGNFWNSSGSVLQIWREQAKTGKLTVSHNEMSRYWIDLPAIAQFVNDCLYDMEGGEIFVPKMEKRFLLDITHEMFPTCVIDVTGKLPTERVHEKLFAEHEVTEEYGSHWVIRS